MLTSLVATAILGQSASTPKVAPVKTFPGIRIVSAAAATSGAKFAVGLENGNVSIMNGTNYTTLFNLTGHPGPAYGLAFSPDGKLLATGDETGRIWIWNVANGQKVRELPREKGHQRGIQSLTFSRDNKRIASVGKDDVIQVWNVSGGNPTVSMKGMGANFFGVGFASTGGLVTGTLLEGMRIYNAGTGALASTVTMKPMAGANNLSVNNAGTLAVTAGRDGSAVVYNLATRAQVAKFRNHQDWVLYTAFTPNGKYVFTSSNDMTISLGAVANSQRVATIQGASMVGSPLAVTGDGKLLVTSDDGDNLKLYTITPAQPAAAAPAPRRRR